MPAGMDDQAARMWLADHLAESNSAQMADIAARLPTVPDLNDKAWHALFSCWFEKDPAAAWASAFAKGEHRDIALEEWAALDPASARAAFDKPTEHDLAVLLGGAFRKEPAAAFSLMDEILARQDLTDAEDFASMIPWDSGLADLASIDPERTAAWVKRFPEGSRTGEMLWGRWKHDGTAAAKWLGEQPNPQANLADLAVFLSRNGDRYLPGLMDFIAASYPASGDRNRDLAKIFEGLAERDPDFASKEAARVIPDQRIRAQVIGDIARALARTDFAKAWSLLDGFTSEGRSPWSALPSVEFAPGVNAGERRSIYRRGTTGTTSPTWVKARLLDDLMETNQTEAVRLMEGLPPADFAVIGKFAFETWLCQESEQAIRWLAVKMGDQGNFEDIRQSLQEFLDSERPLEFFAPLIHSLPAGTVRTALATQEAGRMAESDPAAALAFARDVSTAEEPVSAVYIAWAADDPEAALDCLTGDTTAPAAAWAAVTEQAFAKNPDAAADAIETLPNGPARDAAISSIVKTTLGSDPVQTGAWALSLGDAAMRQAAVESFIDAVASDLRLARDVATMEAMKRHLQEASHLSEAERRHWLDRIDRELTPP